MAESWWVISSGTFIDALNRAHAGEDPELIYLEIYANSDIIDADGEPE